MHRFLAGLAGAAVLAGVTVGALAIVPSKGGTDAATQASISFFNATTRGDTAYECQAMTQGERDALFAGSGAYIGGVSPDQCASLLASGGGKFQVAYKNAGHVRFDP